MNKERRKQALKRNIEITEGALQHANELIKRKDQSAVAFPEKREKFISEMKIKLINYQKELEKLEAVD